MTEFLFILTNVMMSISSNIFIRYVTQLRNQLDRPALGKLMVNHIIPGIIFMNLYSSDIDFSLLLYIMIFLFIFALLSYAVSRIIAAVFGVKGQHTVLFTNSSLFYNAGNYGVPVNDLVFKSDPFAMSVQVMMVVFQNIIAYSYGIFVLSAENVGKFKALLGYFKMPIFYGLFSGLIFNYFNIGLPTPVISSLDYIRDAMIGMVLFILGTQIAGIRFRHLRFTAFIATAVKLLVIPAM